MQYQGIKGGGHLASQRTTTLRDKVSMTRGEQAIILGISHNKLNKPPASNSQRAMSSSVDKLPASRNIWQISKDRYGYRPSYRYTDVSYQSHNARDYHFYASLSGSFRDSSRGCNTSMSDLIQEGNDCQDCNQWYGLAYWSLSNTSEDGHNGKDMSSYSHVYKYVPTARCHPGQRDMFQTFKQRQSMSAKKREVFLPSINTSKVMHKPGNQHHHPPPHEDQYYVASKGRMTPPPNTPIDSSCWSEVGSLQGEAGEVHVRDLASSFSSMDFRP